MLNSKSPLLRSMPAVKKRLGASILLTLLSLVSLILLLPNSGRVNTHLRKIPGLGNTVDDYAGLFSWEQKYQEFGHGNTRLVVFGDSWVDDSIEDGEEEKGNSWPNILCAQLNCSAQLNFAASQPSSSDPSDIPTGARTSNAIYHKAIANQQFLPLQPSNKSFPDLAQQVQDFISLPIPQSGGETVFLVSLGFWDIYDYANLDYTISPRITDDTVDELFDQLDILYSHFKYNITAIPSSNGTRIRPPTFRVLIPKLFDPTLTPGWSLQRPAPLSPSTASEQQKNAVYLTDRWNYAVENRLGPWMKDLPRPRPEAKYDHKILKDVFYYDLPRYLLDTIVEHHLESHNLTDGNGLGKGRSKYGNVDVPCVSNSTASPEDLEGSGGIKGRLVCKDPESHLFWDAWSLGPRTKQSIGVEVAGLMAEGDSLRKIWEDVSKEGF